MAHSHLIILALLIVVQFLAAPLAQASDTTERTQTYPITGTTGIALYRSIGERGPSVAGRRTIAHTSFALTWTRDYRPQADGACVLAVARPHLTVTYTLPKAPAGLEPAVRESWGRFIAGIRTHEHVHGRAIVAMVKRIEAFSTGLSAPADPGCRKVRAKLQAFLRKSIDAHTAESRAFDKREWSEDGAMRALVLALVNGP